MVEQRLDKTKEKDNSTTEYGKQIKEDGLNNIKHGDFNHNEEGKCHPQKNMLDGALNTVCQDTKTSKDDVETNNNISSFQKKEKEKKLNTHKSKQMGKVETECSKQKRNGHSFPKDQRREEINDHEDIKISKAPQKRAIQKKGKGKQSNSSSHQFDSDGKSRSYESLPVGGILFLLGMISIVGCALLAHMGFQGRINTVGVDLGTTFSVIAVNEHGTVRVIGRDGKYGMDIDGNKKAGASLYPGWEKSTSTNVYNVYNKLSIQVDSILRNLNLKQKDFIEENQTEECDIQKETDLGIKFNPLIASITYFNQESGVLVGDEAKPYLTRDPEHTIYNAKRFIGQDYSDAAVQEEASRHPYHVVPYKAPPPIIKTRELMKRMRFASGVGFQLLPKEDSASLASSNNENHGSSSKIKYISWLIKQVKDEILEILLHKLDFYFTKFNINIKQNMMSTTYPENSVNLIQEEQKIDDKEFKGPIVPPEDIGSYIVNHLKSLAVAYLGHDQLTTAIIAVPAKFNGRQKQATVSAFNKAGFKVNRIIEEPTAAALAYGLHQKPNVHHILVYDFGGGTLDVSLLYVKDGFVSVMGIEGDEHLGGSDFDHCLEEYLLEKYSAETSVVTKEDTHLDLPECSSYTRLMIAEDLKKRLSSLTKFPKTEATFDCVERQLSLEQSNETEVKNSVYHSFALSNDEFYHTCSNVFERVLQPVERILQYSSMTAQEIDEVVMVGGTTRIPKINEMLKTYLKKDGLNNYIDPDITVAVGVACIID